MTFRTTLTFDMNLAWPWLDLDHKRSPTAMPYYPRPYTACTSSSSSAFPHTWKKPQMSNLHCLTKSVVIRSSDFEPQSLVVRGVSSGQCSLLVWSRRGQNCRICSGVWSPVWHSHSGVWETPIRYKWARRRQCPVLSRKIVVCCALCRKGSASFGGEVCVSYYWSISRRRYLDLDLGLDEVCQLNSM